MSPQIPQIGTWANRPDTTTETIDAIQAGLTVRLVMTARRHLMTCTPRHSVDSLVANNVDRFSAIPVVENGLICGLYRAEQWFDVDQPPHRPVGNDFEHLAECDLIGSDASILDFVLTAARHPTRLVVSGSEIVGLVCLADLQKLPVRAALFSVVTALEITMANRIQAEWPDSPTEWLCLLSPERREKVADAIANARQNDTYISHIASTQFGDKATIILKQSLVGGSKSQLKRELRAIQKLRDDLAHSNDYAATPSAARTLSQTVTAILRIANQLRVTDDRNRPHLG